MARKQRNGSGVQLGDDVVRAMVLQGAARVLAARGVRATGIDDIIEAARLSRRTLYRVYDSKEDVMLALYRVGTERLLQACRSALDEEVDVFRQTELCIDAHLQTAREQGRLMFVLGGEAHRQESLLHARRMEVHEALASMLASRARATLPHPPDKLMFRGLLFALEGLTRRVLEEGDEGRNVVPECLAQARAVMLRIAISSIAAEGNSGKAEGAARREARG
ncbi:MAG: TetR/AcrR family transcriptional regulator [Polyangiaceae bacterium]